MPNSNRTNMTQMNDHDQNHELFQIYDEARCRVAQLKANPEADGREMDHWEKTANQIRERLILANQPLVRSIAVKFSCDEITIKDLVAEGQFGLVKAIEKFNRNRGCKFSTHAYRWIRQSISRSFGKYESSKRIPEGKQAAIHKMKQVEEQLMKALATEPTHQEIADAMGLTVKQVLDLETTDANYVSLDAPLGDMEGATMYDSYAANDPNPWEYALQQEQLSELKRALQLLAADERKVVVMKSSGPKTGPSYEEIGKAIGRSGERARQLYEVAIRKMRILLSEHEKIQSTLSIEPVLELATTKEASPKIPVTPSKGFRLKMRAVESNPDHHLMMNNGEWYCAFTLLRDDGTKTRVRNSLYADTVEAARKHRDKLILLYQAPLAAFAH
jgi:RNA polymerase primary sigma factor